MSFSVRTAGAVAAVALAGCIPESGTVFEVIQVLSPCGIETVVDDTAKFRADGRADIHTICGDPDLIERQNDAFWQRIDQSWLVVEWNPPRSQADYGHTRIEELSDGAFTFEQLAEACNGELEVWFHKGISAETAELHENEAQVAKDIAAAFAAALQADC